MKEVRLGIIGTGGMGHSHARTIQNGKAPGLKVSAVCDIREEAMQEFGSLPRFSDSRELIRSGACDAVLIATPHYSHTTIGIDALEQGLHVLVEKPISVHKADAERLIAAHRSRKQVFAAMFNQRTDPFFIKLKNLIDRGDLGKIMRMNWIVTTWFRTDYYYAKGDWRATWAGEGGGVLLNQCPHNLDLLQWLFGMPTRVRAFCALGKHHAIEVEDEVTAYLEFANGATGVFVTSTGEAPGTNRLEVVGEQGLVVLENDRLLFRRNEVNAVDFRKNEPKSFAKPPVWNIDIPLAGHGPQHAGILQNFAEAILSRRPLIAPARDGVRSVELGNAMLFSSLKGRAVDLPLDAQAYERQLKQLIRAGGKVSKKTARPAGREDMGSSFQ